MSLEGLLFLQLQQDNNECYSIIIVSLKLKQPTKVIKQTKVLMGMLFLQDGVVDFREYVMAISMLIEGSAVEKLRWSFKLYDKDRDGAITREEMLDIMQVRLLCCVIHKLCPKQMSGPTF